MKAIVLLVVGGFLILVPQWFVYSGNSLAGRYLTPGNLFIVFAAALGLYLCSNNFVERDRAKLRGIVVGMLIAVTLYRLLGTYREANAAALATYKFQKKTGRDRCTQNATSCASIALLLNERFGSRGTRFSCALPGRKTAEP
jgi:heme A synthase